ncbi:hypothetical protein BD311DRAFT_144149 [Dichomitus squalens]|uniref:Uncharacterized protein n=1 Tax=Dichomitus squalens TaxID=114155 RepID=A0A4Q9M7R4_9APHY|nr:hypothetical protein BD311DRAFT_144149 [Dichomitus squalens]
MPAKDPTTRCQTRTCLSCQTPRPITGHIIRGCWQAERAWCGEELHCSNSEGVCTCRKGCPEIYTHRYTGHSAQQPGQHLLQHNYIPCYWCLRALGGVGVSLFLRRHFPIVYSVGMSGFTRANESMMIEVIPISSPMSLWRR